jgi:hypothetical protein
MVALRCGALSLDHLGDLEQDLVGERDAERLRRLQVHHEVEAHRPLDGQVGGLAPGAVARYNRGMIETTLQLAPDRWAPVSAPDLAALLEQVAAPRSASAAPRAENAALRPVVLWRKSGFGADSAAGSRFAERLPTVVATCRQQGRRLLDFLVAAAGAKWRGTVAPWLLRERQGS